MLSVPARTLIAQSPNKESGLSPEVRSLARRAIAAVGLILVRNSSDDAGQGPRPRGSAVLVRADGVVATNLHVISNAKNGELYDEIWLALSSSNGRAEAAQNRYRLRPAVISQEYDLALLRIESSETAFPVVEMGDSHAVELLDDLIIIGFPEKGGSTVTVNRGVVEGKDLLGNWIKTDARVIHGNSGGAAINGEGKLIGIPTKVISDEQAVDKDGDGFPDYYRRYGAVGFLRPAHLLADMMARLDKKTPTRELITVMPKAAPGGAGVAVRGVVRSAPGGKPVAGALVGLVVLGSQKVTEASLLAWGNADADGEFHLNKPVPPGRYTLKVKAMGHEPYSRDVEINQTAAQIAIELRRSKDN
jgi:S1-C subfamily serine protease